MALQARQAAQRPHIDLAATRSSLNQSPPRSPSRHGSYLSAVMAAKEKLRERIEALTEEQAQKPCA